MKFDGSGFVVFLLLFVLNMKFRVRVWGGLYVLLNRNGMFSVWGGWYLFMGYILGMMEIRLYCVFLLL